MFSNRGHDLRTTLRTNVVVFYVFIVIFVQNYNGLRKIGVRIGSTASNPVGVTLLGGAKFRLSTARSIR
jgi:hypothetical protein